MLCPECKERTMRRTGDGYAICRECGHIEVTDP